MTIDDDCCWELRWIAGPDAGGSFRLPPGRWLVGRAPQAHVRCDDPLLEPFHLEVMLRRDGGLDVRQLAGRQPVRRAGDRIEIGSSVLEIARADAHPAMRPHPLPPLPPSASRCERRTVVVRSPRIRSARPAAPTAPDLDPPVLERGTPSSTSVVSTAVGVVAAAGIGIAIDQAVLALFALVGACGAASAWVVEARTARARNRRAIARHLETVAAWSQRRQAHAIALEQHHVATTLTLPIALEVLRGVDRRNGRALAAVWERQRADDDAFRPSLGPGRLRLGELDPVVPDAVIPDATVPDAVIPDGRSVVEIPVPIDLGEGARVALLGPFAERLARAIVVQLAVATGPADWRLVVLSDRPERWRWTAVLPHAALSPATSETFDDPALSERVAGLASVHVLVVTDRRDAVTTGTSTLRRWLARSPGAALVFVDREPSSAAPACCTTVVATRSDGTARCRRVDAVEAEPAECRVAGLGLAASVAAAQHLGRLADPEVTDAASSSVPIDIGLESLMDPSESIAAVWAEAGHDAPLLATLGVVLDAPDRPPTLTIDLARDGPHALVAGTTGSGKSEFLRSLVFGIARSCPPEQVQFVLIDFKGGAAFDCCASLPHVAELVTDLEPGRVGRLVRSLDAELGARERLLREFRASDLSEMRSRAGDPVVPRVVVVIDEFAVLATEHPSALRALLGVARRGRSLGVHLVLATQRPTGIVDDEIRANTDLRVALRLIDPLDALDVVGDGAPASFPRRATGRLMLRTGGEPAVTVQSARCHDPAGMTERIAVAAAQSESADVGWRLSCPPLPTRLSVGEVPAGAIGWIDEIGHHHRTPLVWDVGDGHLLVVGATGSGVTSTLITAAVTVGDGVDLMVIDAVGDARWDTVSMHSWCAGAVRPGERERLWRLLRRARSATLARPCLLVVDGVQALRSALDSVERLEDAELCDQLLADPPTGLTLLVGVDRVAGLPPSLVDRCRHRWLLGRRDPADAVLLGVALPDEAPAPVPGRLIVSDGARAREAQVVTSPALPPPGRRTAQPIEVLPSVVRPPDGRAPAEEAATWCPVIGFRADDGAPMSLPVPEGEHLLIVGPPRSGRTNALTLLQEAWMVRHPEGRVAAVLPRRSSAPMAPMALDEALDLILPDLSIGRPTLLVIDDAELVHDSSAALAGLLARQRDPLLVMAATRPDALRQAFGHWTTLVRRSRLGVVMTGGDDLDGELLSATLPRRHPIGARPGLAWVVGDGTARLAQLFIASGRPVDEPVRAALR